MSTTAADALARDWVALDVARVLEAASSFVGGENPYDIVGYLYSPVATVLAVPGTWLPYDTVRLLWLALNVLTVAFLIRRAGGGTLGIIAFLLFLPTASDLILGNVTVLLTAAAWLAISNRTGVPLGILLAAFPKPWLLPVLIWLLVHRRIRAVEAASSAAVAGLLTLVLTGPDDFVAFIGRLVGGGGFSYRFAGNLGLSLFDIRLWIIAAVLAIVVMLWLVRYEVVGLAAAVISGLLISPWAGLYAGVPLILALPSMARSHPRTGFVLTIAAVPMTGWITLPLFAITALLALVPLRPGLSGGPEPNSTDAPSDHSAADHDRFAARVDP